jgi:hypothetical protein
MNKKIAIFIFIFTICLLVFSPLLSAQAQQATPSAKSSGTTVQAKVGQFYLNLSGYVSPYASVVLSSNGVTLATIVADGKGNFSISQVIIKAGFSNFCLDAIDFKRIGESYTCFNIPPATGSVTKKNIFLPPTLGLSRTKVNEGGSATAFGYTMPGALVTLNINGETQTTHADQAGYYQFILKDLKAGNYSLYATAKYQGKDSLTPTKKLQLESVSKPKQLLDLLTNWWQQLLRFLKDWLLVLIAIPIFILIIILIWRLWGRKLKLKNPFAKRLLHHSWWLGY